MDINRVSKEAKVTPRTEAEYLTSGGGEGASSVREWEGSQDGYEYQHVHQGR